MNAVYAALVCIAGALICTLLRPQRPELAIAAAIAAGTAALTICLPDIRQAVAAVGALAADAGLGREYSSIVLRACGISLIAEFASQICADAGEASLAGRIKLAARLTLIVMAAPIIADVISQSASLLSGS